MGTAAKAVENAGPGFNKVIEVCMGNSCGKPSALAGIKTALSGFIQGGAAPATETVAQATGAAAADAAKAATTGRTA
jgi:hypothetical protein